VKDLKLKVSVKAPKLRSVSMPSKDKYFTWTIKKRVELTHKVDEFATKCFDYLQKAQEAMDAFKATREA